MKNYSVYFFDIDGTLAASKQKISNKIAKRLSKLSKKNKIAILSGANKAQIKENLLDLLTNPNFQNIYLLATSGAALYQYDIGNQKYTEVYNFIIPESEVEKIQNATKEAFREANVPFPRKSYGERLEYRETQLTFSVNGQNAPLEIKSKWDPNQKKRQKIINILNTKLPDYEIGIGGTNSLDFTKKGIDKAYGVNALCNHINVDPADCIFFGDGIFDGGNDYAVTRTKIKAVRVNDPKETLLIIEYILDTQSFLFKIFNPFYWFSKIKNFLIKIFKKNYRDAQYILNQDIERQIYLTRSHKNPVLSPTSYSWESEGVFNPAAIYLNGRVHILYRAIGSDGVSTIGYASSEDGIHFDERLPYPVYYPRSNFELDPSAVEKTYNTDKFCSGGGWCGCEDPKIVKIGDRVFLFYVAFSGWKSVRVATSSISVEDFLNKNWKWTMPKLCSPSGVISKSGGIFPEKIKGKYVFFQRIFPDILLDYIEDLRFDKQSELPNGKHRIPPRKNGWDSRKISFGSVPIKTKHGWLVITHGVNDAADHQYHLGAMLLDLDNPEKIIYRSEDPIISPDLWYENDWKPGIVYPCGAVNKDGTLLIYYGGGDKYVCVASAPFDYFVETLIHHSKPNLKIEKVKFKK